jgi:ParB-like chromosome segregation protein Spo0J
MPRRRKTANLEPPPADIATTVAEESAADEQNNGRSSLAPPPAESELLGTDSTEMSYHPVSKLFPLLEGTEYQNLRKDIEEHGQLVPIVTCQGQILDGRNRYRACRELQITPKCEEWNGTGSLVAFVLSLNFRRRHLTASQRSMIAARAKPLLAVEALKRKLAGRAPDLPRNSEGGSTGEAAELVARQMRVSKDSVYGAQKVLRDGDPQLQDAVDADEVSLSAAADLTQLPLQEQAEAVAGGKPAMKAKVKQIRQQRKDKAKKDRRRGKTVSDTSPATTLETGDGVASDSLVITLTSDDQAIAVRLVEGLGRERAGQVCKALSAILAE